MNEQEARDDETELAQALFRTLFVEGVSFHSSTLIPALTATVRALGYRKHPEPEWEELTERRITYSYGVNRDQRYTSFYSTFERMREHVEQVTQGGVDVTKREQRTVAYGPWEPTA